MNYLDWAECIIKDAKKVDNELSRLIEKSKKCKTERLEKFHKKSYQGKFAKRRD
jgi:hypothetical protein